MVAIAATAKCDKKSGVNDNRAHSHFPGALYQSTGLEYNELRG